MGNAPLIGKETYEERSKKLFLDHSEVDQLYRVFVKYANASCPEDLLEKKLPDPPREQCKNDPSIWACKGPHMKILRMEQFLSFPCLRAAPFAPSVFSAFKDDPEGLTFDGFILLASCLHPRAPSAVKAAIAFRIFDFNCSGEIEECDVVTALEIMTGLKDLWQHAKNKHCHYTDARNSIRWCDKDFPARLSVRKEEEGTILADAARNLGRDSKIDRADVEKALAAHEAEMKDMRQEDPEEQDAPEVSEEEEKQAPPPLPPPPPPPPVAEAEGGAEGEGGDEEANGGSGGSEGNNDGTEGFCGDGAKEDDNKSEVVVETFEDKYIAARKRSVARAVAITPELKLAVCRMGDRIFSCLDQDKSKCVTSVEFEKVCEMAKYFIKKNSHTAAAKNPELPYQVFV